MRIRTFQAATIPEAMHLVREAMGENAVIVSTYRSRRGRGVEVTAAVEEAEPPAATAPAGPTAATVAEELARTLVWHGVPNRLTEQICVAVAGLRSTDGSGALAAALEACFGFQPLPVTPARPIMLIGPPGVGKTVTTAKLAARAVMAGIKVSVITCDTVRAGGVDQLAAFIKLLKQPLITVDTPDELGRAIERAAADGPVFVDSPGTNPYAAADLADLAAFIAAADMDPVLVLPAGGDSAEGAEQAAAFARLGAERILLTRLDASRRLGGALSAAHAGRLRFANASITPFVAQGLHPLRPAALARLLLRDPAHEHLEAQFDEAAA